MAEDYQDVLAKCYVAMSEVNFDLERWEISLIKIDYDTWLYAYDFNESNALTR